MTTTENQRETVQQDGTYRILFDSLISNLRRDLNALGDSHVKVKWMFPFALVVIVLAIFMSAANVHIVDGQIRQHVPICKPGEFRCNKNNVESCDQGWSGLYWRTHDCPNGMKCVENDFVCMW
jgi:hypothetical protein